MSPTPLFHAAGTGRIFGRMDPTKRLLGNTTNETTGKGEDGMGWDSDVVQTNSILTESGHSLYDIEFVFGYNTIAVNQRGLARGMAGAESIDSCPTNGTTLV